MHAGVSTSVDLTICIGHMHEMLNGVKRVNFNHPYEWYQTHETRKDIGSSRLKWPTQGVLHARKARESLAK